MIARNVVSSAATRAGYGLAVARAVGRNSATLRLIANTGAPAALDQVDPRDARTLAAADIVYRISGPGCLAGGLQLTDAGRALAARL